MTEGIVFARATRGHEHAAIHVVELAHCDEVRWVVAGRMVLSRTCIGPDDVVRYVETLRTDMAAIGWQFGADLERRH